MTRRGKVKGTFPDSVCRDAKSGNVKLAIALIETCLQSPTEATERVRLGVIPDLSRPLHVA